MYSVVVLGGLVWVFVGALWCSLCSLPPTEAPTHPAGDARVEVGYSTASDHVLAAVTLGSWCGREAEVILVCWCCAALCSLHPTLGPLQYTPTRAMMIP